MTLSRSRDSKYVGPFTGLLPICLLAALGSLSACGNDPEIKKLTRGPATDLTTASNTRTGTEEVNSADAQSAPTDSQGDAYLHWHWPCENSPRNVEERDAVQNLGTVENRGPHKVTFDGQKLDLEITGRFCRNESIPRQILFLVDVSQEMNFSDPATNGTCARMQALTNALNSLQNNRDAEVALVTFNSAIRLNTQGFISPALLKNTYVTVDNLCPFSRYELTADYDAALKTANGLYAANNKRQISKETYLLVNAPSTNSKSASGYAEELRGRGVMISALTLKNDLPEVKTKMVSMDYKGKPRYRISGTTENLSTDVKSVLLSTVNSGKLTYRSLSSSTNGQVTIGPGDRSGSNDFKLRLNPISRIEYPSGIEFEYNYIDSFGFEYGDKGRLTW